MSSSATTTGALSRAAATPESRRAPDPAAAGDPLDGLAAWLLDSGCALPSVELLRATRLSGYAYAACKADAATCAALRPDFLSALARHERIKREFVPLLRAWNAVGIVPVIFKGFHLAEFVYPVAGMRFHGDVDVLVHAEEVRAASEVARALRWAEVRNTADDGEPHIHNACTLDGPAGDTSIDLHRCLLPSPLPFFTKVQRRITRAAWAASTLREWEGARFRELAAVDALLVGLVLARCWGPERWQLKPHDVLDFQLLTARYGITLSALRARAQELGAARTLALFLDRCNPSAGRLTLGAPARSECRRWEREIRSERSPLGEREMLLHRALKLGPAMIDLVRALPALIAARRALRRSRDMTAMLQSLTPVASAARRDPRRHFRFVRGIRWGAWLLPHNDDGDCVLRSLALYVMLRKAGWPAHFVSGVRRDARGVVGHAWVELGGRTLSALERADNRRSYAVNFEYPPAPPSG